MHRRICQIAEREAPIQIMHRRSVQGAFRAYHGPGRLDRLYHTELKLVRDIGLVLEPLATHALFEIRKAFVMALQKF